MKLEGKVVVSVKNYITRLFNLDRQAWPHSSRKTSPHHSYGYDRGENGPATQGQ